ncbi:MAG: LacI family transcriptional regulator [Defluviitaleaceae bacterium]|nr:LacI family transcriptional regulator [Defluviitaleaceae bacterium]
MKKVTLDNIARELGVTKNTVSKALRGQPGVSEELRGKIVRLSDEYGYQKKDQPPKEQPFLRITLVSNDSFIRDSYFTAALLSGIFDYASMHQVSIRNVIVDMVRDDMKNLMPLQEKYCDGILVIGVIPDDAFVQLADLGIPLAAVDHYSSRVICDYVTTANRQGILQALEFLAARNHRRIGFINNVNRAYSFDERCAGYRDGMEKLGLPVDPRFVWPSSNYDDRDYLRGQLDKLPAAGEAPTAWICVNDYTAANFCSVLAERGLRVPEDVSVVGFDNIASLRQPITTLEIRQQAMGGRALQRLLQRIRQPDEPYENIVVFPRLVDKGSVLALPRRN